MPEGDRKNAGPPHPRHIKPFRLIFRQAASSLSNSEAFQSRPSIWLFAHFMVSQPFSAHSQIRSSCFALFVESSDPLCPCLCGGGPSSHARGDSSCGYGCHQPSQADDVIGPCGKSSMSRGTPRLCPWLELTGPGSVWAAEMLSPFDVAGLCGLHSGIFHVAACVPSRGGSATESLG